MAGFRSADSMLAEINSESLQNLLGALRHEDVTKTFAVSLGHTLSLRRGDVVEIQGPAASGKSSLLFHLILTCIMPATFHSVDFGGWDKAAILLDTDGTFNIRHFHRILVSRLSAHLAQNFLASTRPNTTAEELASQCVMNLHIFRPTSSLQLAATILRLPAYHATSTSLHSTEIGLLAIDSISAFYWQDRFTTEQLRSAKQDARSKPTLSNPLLHVLVALQIFQASYAPLIVLTNWGLNSLKRPASDGEPTSPFYKQHLYPFPAPFDRRTSISQSAPSSPGGDATLRTEDQPPMTYSDESHLHPSARTKTSQANQPFTLTHHITLNPPFIAPFDSASTLEEAQRMEFTRFEVVKEGKVFALVRQPGTQRVEEFNFSVRDLDVVVDPYRLPLLASGAVQH